MCAISVAGYFVYCFCGKLLLRVRFMSQMVLVLLRVLFMLQAVLHVLFVLQTVLHVLFVLQTVLHVLFMLQATSHRSRLWELSGPECR